MRKISAILLSAVLIVSLSACTTPNVNISVEKGGQEASTPVEAVTNPATVPQESSVAPVVPDANAPVASDANAPVAPNGGAPADPNAGAPAATTITREQAIAIALQHAGLAEKDVINLTAEYDKERIGDEWDVEFDQGRHEYSYEINAATGEIIKWEKEIDD